MGFTPRTVEIFRRRGAGGSDSGSAARLSSSARACRELGGKVARGDAVDAGERRAQGAGSVTVLGCGARAGHARADLRKRASELGADIRMSTELVRFEQDELGVTAWLTTRDGGERVVRADYMIAADGGRSSIRTALGIGTQGRGHMSTIRSVLFRAPLDAYLGKGVFQFEVVQDGFQAFLTTYHDGRWLLIFADDVERTDDELCAAITRAVGVRFPRRSSREVVGISARSWPIGSPRGACSSPVMRRTAFRRRAAVMARTPGFTTRTTSRWKLASVLAGKSERALLDTYDAERRPVAWVRHQQIFTRPDYAARGNGIADGEPVRDDVAMELGQLYRSAGILGAGEELPVAARPDEWKGQPGTRAPHVWIEAAKTSTIDWFGRDWVVLADDPAWTSAGVRIVRVADLAPADAVRAAFVAERRSCGPTVTSRGARRPALRIQPRFAKRSSQRRSRARQFDRRARRSRGAPRCGASSRWGLRPSRGRRSGRSSRRCRRRRPRCASSHPRTRRPRRSDLCSCTPGKPTSRCMHDRTASRARRGARRSKRGRRIFGRPSSSCRSIRRLCISAIGSHSAPCSSATSRIGATGQHGSLVRARSPRPRPCRRSCSCSIQRIPRRKPAHTNAQTSG